MARLRHWESRLAEAIARAKAEPFIWGAHDCVLWAASAVEATTGVDYMADFRGRYKSAAGAARLIKREGPTLAEAVDKRFARVPACRAQRGDLLLAQKALGICDGAIGWFVTPDQGLQRVKVRDCEAAWRV